VSSPIRTEPPDDERGSVRHVPFLSVDLDFDGTLAESNVAIDLVAEFVPNGARLATAIDLALRAREITLREAWARQAALLPWDRLPEMSEFVRRRVQIRAGAREFLELTHRHRVPVAVLSGGLDFYIRDVLDREGLALPVRAARVATLPDGGVEVEFPNGHPTCRECGTCKAGIVTEGDDGRVSVFIGDGSTDRYAAEVADLVFARGRLLDYCREQGIPAYAFDDFDPVTERFRDWLEYGAPVVPASRRGLRDSRCPISSGLATATRAVVSPIASGAGAR